MAHVTQVIGADHAAMTRNLPTDAGKLTCALAEPDETARAVLPPASPPMPSAGRRELGRRRGLRRGSLIDDGGAGGDRRRSLPHRKPGPLPQPIVSRNDTSAHPEADTVGLFAESLIPFP